MNEPAVDDPTTDMTTTVPNKRRHAFVVTPEGAAPATTPRYAPRVSTDELDAAHTRMVRLGAVLFIVGVAVTVGSYVLASAAGGSRFLIGGGPMIAGIFFMLRGSR
jgi:uncharacterized protein YjeT (DUF2065 family)